MTLDRCTVALRAANQSPPVYAEGPDTDQMSYVWSGNPWFSITPSPSVSYCATVSITCRIVGYLGVRMRAKVRVRVRVRVSALGWC